MDHFKFHEKFKSVCNNMYSKQLKYFLPSKNEPLNISVNSNFDIVCLTQVSAGLGDEDHPYSSFLSSPVPQSSCPVGLAILRSLGAPWH